VSHHHHGFICQHMQAALCHPAPSHALTHTLSHSVTHSVTQSHSHSLTQSLTHSLTHSLTYQSSRHSTAANSSTQHDTPSPAACTTTSKTYPADSQLAVVSAGILCQSQACGLVGLTQCQVLHLLQKVLLDPAKWLLRINHIQQQVPRMIQMPPVSGNLRINKASQPFHYLCLPRLAHSQIRCSLTTIHMDGWMVRPFISQQGQQRFHSLAPA